MIGRNFPKARENQSQFIPHLISSTNVYDGLEDAGMENLIRSESKLVRNQTAIRWLCNAQGLQKATIEKFHLGIAEDFNLADGRVCSNALCVPLIGCDGRPKRRRVYFNIPEVTINPKSTTTWSQGSPLVCYSSKISGKKRIFICNCLKDLWWLDQAANDSNELTDVLFVASTHDGTVPEEFNISGFWSQFEEIYFSHISNEIGNHTAENLRKICFADVRSVMLPEGFISWTEFFLAGGRVKQLTELLAVAKPLSSELAANEITSLESLGEFPIDPVNCNGAYVNGNLYYPYRVERREIEKIKHRDGSVSENVVTSYQTKVVRSDGVILDIGYLPAPRGTPVSERVLALSDGTRIDQIPRPNLYASWHLESITNFIKHGQSGKGISHRPLQEILVDLESHFQRSIWLPFEEDYTILGLYTALSFVYNVFEAVPLLMVCGPKGSAKSDLGSAIQTVAFNAMTLGQGTAASAIRVMNESRGLIVWDDLEAIAAKGENDAFSDIHQMLKLSYKKKTSKKAITGRNGQTTMFDFYGPKVVNNTQGVDAILGSRMVAIQTKKLPPEMRGKWNLDGSDPESTFALRNELHVWGMSTAAEIDRQYRLLLPNMRGDRKDEILLPLRTIAELSGDERTIKRLELARLCEELNQVDSLEPLDLLEKAVKNCIVCGYTKEIALPHIQLQIALIIEGNRNVVVKTDVHFWLQAQWIGNSMDSYGFKEKDVRVRRARLYGKETRIYQLRTEFVHETLNELFLKQGSPLPTNAKEPFDFCRNLFCSDCPFITICDKTVPGLKPSKNKRFIH